MEEQQNSKSSVDPDFYVRVETQKIISLNKFIILSILSIGLYEIWWIYKAWRFFKEKNELDIYPAIRALLSVFFLYFLYNRILDYAKDEEYAKSYSPGFLFIGFVSFSLLTRLPDPIWVIGMIRFVFSIPPFLALNSAKTNSDEISVVVQEDFNLGQIFLIVIGSIIWILFFASLFINEL